jgi:hypothetical protein
MRGHQGTHARSQGLVKVEGRIPNLVFGYGMAVGLGALALAQCFLHHLVFYITMRGGWNLRTATVGLVQKKLLRINAQVRMPRPSGDTFHAKGSARMSFTSITHQAARLINS